MNSKIPQTDAICGWANEQLKRSSNRLFEVEELLGDASTRSYFRLRTESESWIVMVLADRKGAYVSEEQGAHLSDELPYAAMTRFLRTHNWPVPQMHAFDEERGWLLLEDFGDRALQDIVEEADDAAIDECYRQAVELIFQLQSSVHDALTDEVPAAHLRNDQATLLWEFRHYIEYGLGTAIGNTIEAQHEDFLLRRFAELSEEIANAGYVLAHRDYHSRNIMVRPTGALGIIDFQDAFLASATYDLASLLLDSYVDLGWDRIDSLVAHFHALVVDEGLFSGSLEPFRRLFDIQGIQRNLKAAGRFVYIDKVKGSARYLDAIPHTLENVRINLGRHDDLRDIGEVLAQYEPMLRGGEDR